MTMEIDHYILCLDTDKYAGNFEREATAYATGKIGECGVGDDEAELFAEADVPQGIIDELEEKVLSRSDEDGCSRPCEIQPSPEWVNDGMGTQYRQSKDTPPTEGQIVTYRNLCRKSKQSDLNMAIQNKWPQNNIAVYERELAEVETQIPCWFPAYNSVGIFLSEPLSEAALHLVLTRAKEYFTRENITLEQVRLVTLLTDTKSEILEFA